MSNEWFYIAGSERVGPHTPADIRTLIAEGIVAPETLVWTGGMDGWSAAAATSLGAHFDGPPPAPGRVPPPPPPGATVHRISAGGPAPWRSFGEAVRVCFSKYITFSGRASRSEYWWFALFCTLAALVLAFVESSLGRSPAGEGLLSTMFSLATFLPTLAVTSRRFHDSGRSFWWFLLPAAVILGGLSFILVSMDPAGEPSSGLVTLVGAAVTVSVLFTFYLLVARPEAGPNRFDRPD